MGEYNIDIISQYEIASVETLVFLNQTQIFHDHKISMQPNRHLDNIMIMLPPLPKTQ